MAMHWKSSKGYINVKQMEDSHLANAWSTVLRKIEDNTRLPKSLVEAAGLDKYDDEPLHELALGFQTEWDRRLEERAIARVAARVEARTAAIYQQRGADFTYGSDEQPAEKTYRVRKQSVEQSIHDPYQLY